VKVALPPRIPTLEVIFFSGLSHYPLHSKAVSLTTGDDAAAPA